ncbi:MAG: DUF4258 domain-containing protein [Verrucomicrobiota bacterium]|nr:hypothetical protein [Verrucomicrobiota bacterium]MDE3066437.1 DUF4258 domain-containing protein [Verrucomicrobiota bacterium]
MNFRFSKHAENELVLRQIPREFAERVLREPQQIVLERPPKKAYQSKVDLGGKIFLLRVIVDDTTKPVTIVTLYRTKKINKYWKP